MPRQLHLAVAVYGVGGPGQHGLWKDPRVPKNASIDINYYIKTAQVAGQALFDLGLPVPANRYTLERQAAEAQG